MTALEAYRADKIVKGLTVYVEDFGLCIPLKSIPLGSDIRYVGYSHFDHADVYDNSNAAGGELLQYCVLTKI